MAHRLVRLNSDVSFWLGPKHYVASCPSGSDSSLAQIEQVRTFIRSHSRPRAQDSSDHFLSELIEVLAGRAGRPDSGRIAEFLDILCAHEVRLFRRDFALYFSIPLTGSHQPAGARFEYYTYYAVNLYQVEITPSGRMIHFLAEDSDLTQVPRLRSEFEGEMMLIAAGE